VSNWTEPLHVQYTYIVGKYKHQFVRTVEIVRKNVSLADYLSRFAKNANKNDLTLLIKTNLQRF
jgi:hypothetical protein